MWLFVAIFVVLLCVYIRWNGTYWKRRNVAGPTPWPVAGNMMDYLRERKHYGEVYDDIYW